MPCLWNAATNSGCWRASINVTAERLEFDDETVNPDYDRRSAFLRYDVEGARTEWRGDGVLELDLEALAAPAGGDGDEVTAEAHVVRPGDPVRLAHVLDAVDPAAKLDAPETTFPGLAGDMAAAGIGRTLRDIGILRSEIEAAVRGFTGRAKA